MKPRQTAENYLEAMLILKRKNGYILSTDIVRLLSIGRTSVADNLKKLCASGYAVDKGRGHVLLTELGEETAVRVHERRSMLSALLTHVGVSEKQAAEDALSIEHCLSSESLAAIRNFIESGGFEPPKGCVSEPDYMLTVSNAMRRLASLGALTVDMREAFIRDNAAGLDYCSEDAILLRHRCGVHMLWAATVGDGLNALKAAEGISCCVAHGRPAMEAMRQSRPDFIVDRPCLQYCLASRDKLPVSGAVKIRPLMISEAGTVIEHYAMEGDIEHVRGIIREGKMFGAVKDGELAAFIGLHSDGSIGMLEVFPEYRRMGIGAELENFMMNYQLDRGWMPYGQVYTDNTASLKLQSKLGLSVSADFIWWMLKNEDGEEG